MPYFHSGNVSLWGLSTGMHGVWSRAYRQDRYRLAKSGNRWLELLCWSAFWLEWQADQMGLCSDHAVFSAGRLWHTLQFPSFRLSVAWKFCWILPVHTSYMTSAHFQGRREVGGVKMKFAFCRCVLVWVNLYKDCIILSYTDSFSYIGLLMTAACIQGRFVSIVFWALSTTRDYKLGLTGGR